MTSNGGQIPVLRGASIASVSLGFFSLAVFWWYPFSLILSSIGLVIGLICLARGVRGIYGENFALIGTTLCGMVVGIVLTLTQLLHFAIWDR